MTIENDHLFLVNDEEKSYQIKYEKIKEDIEGDITQFPEAPIDTKQYGRQQGAWTEIVHTPEYTDADVDAHLNTNQAEGGQILSYTDGDYKWVTDQSGGGSDFTNYTHPGGISRTVQSRLEDYTNVHDFGAKGDGTTDDTEKIQAAINWVGENGGGTLYFPPGTYMVELKGQKGEGTNNWHNCALSVNADNVHLLGSGQGSTIIRSIATEFEVEDPDDWKDNSYGVIEVIKYPFGNAGAGGTPVQGGSITNMTLDNNCTSDEVMHGGCLHLKHTYNYTVQNVAVKNSPFYGIAMQNGGFKNVTFNNILLEGINRDGIDLKDNGSLSRGIQLNNITCRDVCRGDLDPDNDGTNEHSRFACIDIQGEGVQLNNIVIDGMGSAEASAGIRIKQSGKDAARGNSGRWSSINNVWLNTSKAITHCIQVKAGNVSITNAKLRAPADTGVAFMQENCSISNSFISGATEGVIVEPRDFDSDTEYPEGAGGDYAMIQNNTFKECTTGVVLKRSNCNVSNNVFHKAQVGIDTSDNDVTAAVIFGNIFDTDVLQDIRVRDNRGLFMLNNIGDWSPRISVTKTNQEEIMALEAADGDKQFKISNNGIGFYGQDPVPKQTVSGNITTNTDDVLRALVRDLHQMGLILDDTKD